MQNYIESCQKESERCASYTEERTAHFKNVASITINSDSVIPQEKWNGSEEDFQANTYNENEVNKSIEQNVIKTIEQNVSKTIYFKNYLNNLIQEANLLSTLFGKNIVKNLMTGTE